MVDIPVLTAELTVDPLVRGYSGMSDTEATADLNTAYRSALGGMQKIVEYLSTHDNRTDEGGDTNATLILGRLVTVANSEPFTDPFNRAGSWTAGGSGDNEEIELDAANNKLVFGSAHDISGLNAKDAISLDGSSADDGTYQIVSISLQEVVVHSITVSETLERVFRVIKHQAAKQLTMEQIHNARAILAMLNNPHLTEIDFEDTEIHLAFSDMETCGVWKDTDTTAIIAFSEEQQTRAAELGQGILYPGHIENARA